MIDIQYIDKITSLSKLEISKAEKVDFIKHMENILDYVEILEEFDIDIEVLVDNIVSEAGILRNDKVEASFKREDILKNAHSTENGYFIVPSILNT